MFKKILVTVLSIVIVSEVFSQQIPVGDCGIVYIHDANGAGIKRVYFCNNGTDPYPTARVANVLFVEKGNSKVSEEASDKTENNAGTKETAGFQSVDAIYPNPTSGLFSISFRYRLSNVDIIITDSGGKTVRKLNASGLRISCDISSLPAGTYFISINQNNTIITKKLVKI